MTDADAPRCLGCMGAAIDTVATHWSECSCRWGGEPSHRAHWCTPHSLPGDLPLAGAVEHDGVTDEMLQRAFEIPMTRPMPQTHEADDE